MIKIAAKMATMCGNLISGREDQRLSTEGKNFSKYCKLLKPQEGGGGPKPPFPPNHGGGMTVRVCPRVSCSVGREPITQSEQLLCVRVTAILRTSLFLKRFWGQF